MYLTNEPVEETGVEASPERPVLPLLTIKDVMRELQLARSSVEALIREGLPVIRFGRAIRVNRQSLEQWVKERERRQQQMRAISQVPWASK